MATEAFQDLADVYEAMIDWPKRLAHEQGFFRWLLDRVGARRVLDTACGTGHHAAMFHSWDLHVTGADLSPVMIERARARFGQSETLNWVVRGFDQPADEPDAYDVALCLGNSLALAEDRTTVAAAMRQMLSVVRPGGAICVHVLNLWRLPDGPPLWQKCQRSQLAQGQSLIIKGVHRCGPQGYVDLLVTNLAANPPALRTECAPFLGLEATELEEMARQAGATQTEFYGDYQQRPYNRQQSQDLILVAMR